MKNNYSYYAVSPIKSVLAGILLLIIYTGAPNHAGADEDTPSSERIQIGDALIDVTFAPGTDTGHLAVSRAEMLSWVETAARAIADYYHGFPVRHLHIAINPSARPGLHGTAYRGGEPLIIIRIGKEISAAQLQNDWVLVHEMVHLAFPPVHRRHLWIEEGLATYIEPLARVRAGLMPEQNAWRWLVDGTPKGQPKSGDRGLDNTPTWGRIYWGGALFCLLADLQIRENTDNRFGLEDALRAIVFAGGTMQMEDPWPITKALQIGDQATESSVLSMLYTQMKDQPVEVDLDTIWRRLGVSLNGKQIVFDDSAPQAMLRRALISPPD